MIRIPQSIVNAIHQQGLAEAPHEACGYLAGKNSTIVSVFPMVNIDHSEDHFSLDPKEQFAVIKKIRSESLELIAVYHTHPATPARPSEEDIRLAYDPEITYIIGSLEKEDFDIRAFSIKESTVRSIPLEVNRDASD